MNHISGYSRHLQRRVLNKRNSIDREVECIKNAAGEKQPGKKLHSKASTAGIEKDQKAPHQTKAAGANSRLWRPASLIRLLLLLLLPRADLIYDTFCSNLIALNSILATALSRVTSSETANDCTSLVHNKLSISLDVSICLRHDSMGNQSLITYILLCNAQFVIPSRRSFLPFHSMLGDFITGNAANDGARNTKDN